MKSIKKFGTSLIGIIMAGAILITFHNLTVQEGMTYVQMAYHIYQRVGEQGAGCFLDLNECVKTQNSTYQPPVTHSNSNSSTPATNTSQSSSVAVSTPSSESSQPSTPVNNTPPPTTPTSATVPQLARFTATTVDKVSMLSTLNSIPIVSAYDTSVPYKRAEWKHWSNVANDCWTSREEALALQSTKANYISKDKQSTDKAKACGISTGEWKDPYSNVVETDPKLLDSDHTVALAFAHRAGGHAWSKAQKEAFANDLEHLVITTQKQNRAKSDKGPSEWLPQDSKAHCDYAKIFTQTIKKYNLNLTQADKSALEQALNTCVN